MGDEHPASRALREQSPALWREELLATLVDGEADWLWDSRDLMVALAPFHDCARRLGMEVTPEAFGFALRDGPDGPAYVNTLFSD